MGRLPSGQPVSGSRRVRLRAALFAAPVGLAASVVVDGRAGPLVGVGCAVAGYRWASRMEPAARRRDRLRAAADLPFAMDVVAAALQAGLPVQRAVTSAADAAGGPLGELLDRVARAMALGLAPTLAWEPLRAVAGGDRMVRVMVRSGDSGAGLAGTLGRLAEDLRAGYHATAQAEVRRGAVLIVLPLGLCFLPAFIFAGVVPVVAGVLGDVLR